MTFKERLNSWRERRGEETAVMYEEDGTMKQKSFRQFVCEIEAAGWGEADLPSGAEQLCLSYRTLGCHWLRQYGSFAE